MIYGIDIDGVLARFEPGFLQLLEKHGYDISVFPVGDPNWPNEWFWEKDVPKQVKHDAWEDVKNSHFWLGLDPTPEARGTLAYLSTLARIGNDVYFITSRPGRFAKPDTEDWLRIHGYLTTPTVIIANSAQAKGAIANAIGLDFFIDDRPENCIEVATARGPHCAVFLQDRPWSRSFDTSAGYIRRTSTPVEALDAVTRKQIVERKAA